MFIMHLALQGCLKGSDIDYGLTADTGGHIKYLLELVEASEQHPLVEQIEIITRGFECGDLGYEYSKPFEQVSNKTTLTRIFSENTAYLPKERLHNELDELAGELINHIMSLPAHPDIIHAHYADAGALAACVKAELGIPYIFTGHSLGYVKKEAMKLDCAGETTGMETRIALEELAIGSADTIISSSRDEAEQQYSHYLNAECGKIRIIPPGAHLDIYKEARPSAAISLSINKFLTDPDKPIILAISRPVRKKNLKNLVHAFGRSKALRASANLVIIGGVRDSLNELEPECREVWNELLQLIDYYDLYGQIAYPKTHQVDDIPAIYALTALSGGVFVNPALNEPFGLTLLEASAAGLPIVATDSGGPNDILEACNNGILVSPRDVMGLSSAIEQIFQSKHLYKDFSDNGPAAVNRYSWHSHVGMYANLVGEIIDPSNKSEGSLANSMLVCDIDNTLVGHTESTQRFADWTEKNSSMLFGIATGRSFHSAQSILAQEGAPVPAFIISSVGAEIHFYDQDTRCFRKCEQWSAWIEESWRADEIRSLAANWQGLTQQGLLEQKAHKLSYIVEEQDFNVAALESAMEYRGLRASVIFSHGRYLDILPWRASKGQAAEYVRSRYGLSPSAVVVAGDSGNDVEMLAAFQNAIIVANNRDGVAEREDLKHSYIAKTAYAAGVLEGLSHYKQKLAAI